MPVTVMKEKTMYRINLLKALVFSVAIGFSGDSLQAQESLISNLQQGGYVIYIRHGQASQEARQDTKLPAQIKDCKGQRHITEAGVAAMRTLGNNLRAMKIPVGKAISSPACTAKETAWYALGSSIEVADVLDGNPREQIWTELRPFLTMAPTKGTNTLLFAHSTNIKALTGLAISEGEAVIFQPDGQGGFTYVGRIKPDEWTAKSR
jgi:phosphohistidine phosphatase SixA